MKTPWSPRVPSAPRFPIPVSHSRAALHLTWKTVVLLLLLGFELGVLAALAFAIAYGERVNAWLSTLLLHT